ncbi:MAG: DUF4430 domain-containing protein [Clostridia bacterium]|nr:DUF4430 domain-containing protein [Clostridia bacterium]
MKKTHKLIVCLLLFAFLLPILSVSAENSDNTAERARSELDRVLDAEIAKSASGKAEGWIANELCESIGRGGEWYIFTLAQIGGYDLSACESAMLEYLDSHTIGAATSKQKFALCLAALGSTDAYIYRTLEETIGKLGVMSYAYGLHLLNNSYESTAITTDAAIDKLLEFQLSDGGWSVSGSVSDVDVSAMVLQSLAPHKDNEKVAPSIERALGFLSTAQLEDGDYKSYGVANPQSVAQVIVALSSLSIDLANDQRFIKNGNSLLDGMLKYATKDGFASKEGAETSYTATVQSCYALVSYLRMLDGRASLYILDNCDPEHLRTESATETDTASETDAVDEAEKESFPTYKLICLCVIAIVALVICVLLLALGKRNIKNFIALIVAAAVCAAFILLTDFKRPEDYYGEQIVKDDPIGSVTLTIRCDTVADELENEEYTDGVILDSVSMTLGRGDSVYSILLDASKQYRLQIENNGTEDRAYIAAIEHIYEFEYGDLSGWTYRVNGEDASVGCSEYALSDGDVIEWIYTRELGKDLR